MTVDFELGSTNRSSDATVGGLSWEVQQWLGPFGLMAVRLELDSDGTWLATEPLAGSYGVGRDPAAALSALRSALAAHYNFLAAQGPNRLSPRLASELVALARLRERYPRTAKTGNRSLAPSGTVTTPLPGVQYLALAA